MGRITVRADDADPLALSNRQANVFERPEFVIPTRGDFFRHGRFFVVNGVAFGDF